MTQPDVRIDDLSLTGATCGTVHQTGLVVGGLATAAAIIAFTSACGSFTTGEGDTPVLVFTEFRNAILTVMSWWTLRYDRSACPDGPCRDHPGRDDHPTIKLGRLIVLCHSCLGSRFCAMSALRTR